VSQASGSLVGNKDLIAKIYFPRLFIPMASIGALALDMLIALLLMAALLGWYRRPLTLQIVWLPIFIIAAILATCGISLIFSALNVQFRDVKYVLPYFVQMGLFVTPVIYPITYIPQKYRIVMALNPMAGIVMGFRRSLLATDEPIKIIVVSLVVNVALFAIGLVSFRRMECRFADVI
jgi:lipopolysaccharide transport system permease protein